MDKISIDKIDEARNLFKKLESKNSFDEAVDKGNLDGDINHEALRRFRLRQRLYEIQDSKLIINSQKL